MSGQLQLKQLKEISYSSFMTYLEKKARDLMTSSQRRELNLSSERFFEDTRFCRELKHFFHGTRLPSPMANEMTEYLLLKLNNMYTQYKVHDYIHYYQQVIGSYLVEIVMHPDVTEISLGRNYFQDLQVPSVDNIGAIMLRKMGNLPKLKKLNFRYTLHDINKINPLFPSQIEELSSKSFTFTNKELRSIVESCPELKILKLRYLDRFTESMPIILQLKHLETLHLLSDNDIHEDYAAPMNVISTNTTTDALSTSTTSIRSLGLVLGEENTLHRIVEMWPHLTEIILELTKDVSLASLARLRNLRSLGLIKPFKKSDAYKYILAALGENLFSLYVKDYSGLDLEFIGQTCTNLKSLYLHATSTGLKYPSPSLKTLQNFKTVEILKFDIICAPDTIELIIDQCINVKELYVSSVLSLYSIIVKIIKRTPIDNVQEIHWWVTGATNGNLIEEIRSTYPNIPLRVYSKTDLYPESAVFYLKGSQHIFGEGFP